MLQGTAYNPAVSVLVVMVSRKVYFSRSIISLAGMVALKKSPAKAHKTQFFKTKGGYYLKQRF